jgi:hypothetical protein
MRSSYHEQEAFGGKNMSSIVCSEDFWRCPTDRWTCQRARECLAKARLKNDAVPSQVLRELALLKNSKVLTWEDLNLLEKFVQDVSKPDIHERFDADFRRRRWKIRMLHQPINNRGRGNAKYGNGLVHCVKELRTGNNHVRGHWLRQEFCIRNRTGRLICPLHTIGVKTKRNHKAQKGNE